MDTAEIRPLRRDEVEVRMVAARGRVPGLRALAADLALREDYDPDVVDDLRLVIDEICAILIADAAAGAVMTIRLRIGPDRIEIGATVTLPGVGEPAVLPLSVRILETLSNEFDCVAAGDGMDRVLRLSFVRARGRTALA